MFREDVCRVVSSVDWSPFHGIQTLTLPHMLVLFVGRTNERLTILTKISITEASRRIIYNSATIVGAVGGESTTANLVGRRTLNIKGVLGVTTQLRGSFKVYRQIVQHPLSMSQLRVSAEAPVSVVSHVAFQSDPVDVDMRETRDVSQTPSATWYN